jgi:hypothetical protein
LIFVTQATGVRFAGNKVKGLGKFNRTLIEAASTAQIEKLQDGVVISK